MGAPRRFQSRCHPGLQVSQDWISMCPLSSTLMKLLEGLTQYCPENSFSSLTDGLLAGQLGFIHVSHQGCKKEELGRKPVYFTLFPELTSQHFPTFSSW